MFLTRFSLFKSAKPRNFTYKPMYYNPAEEEGEEEMVKVEPVYRPGATIRKYAGEKWGRQIYHSKYEQSRRRVFTLIIVALLSIFFWFML